MADCNICTAISAKMNVVYEDEKVIALLHPQGAAPGHMLVLPRQHAALLELLPDYVVGALWTKANQLGKCLIDGLGMQGSNLIVQNGLAAGQQHSHAMLHVIPRKENDGMQFLWRPRQIGEEEFSTVELKLKEETKNMGQFEREKPKPIELKPAEKVEQKQGEIDWRIRHLRRIP